MGAMLAGPLGGWVIKKFITENGVEAAIVKYTGVAEGSRMYNVILEEYKKLA